MQHLIEGRIVHYVLRRGQHRPALIVKLFEDPRLANMIVFLDGKNDTMIDILRGQSDHDTGLFVWRTSVRYSEGYEPETWHWIEGESKWY